jgi:transposase InsO family protein
LASLPGSPKTKSRPTAERCAKRNQQQRSRRKAKFLESRAAALNAIDNASRTNSTGPSDCISLACVSDCSDDGVSLFGGDSSVDSDSSNTQSYYNRHSLQKLFSSNLNHANLIDIYTRLVDFRPNINPIGNAVESFIQLVHTKISNSNLHSHSHISPKLLRDLVDVTHDVVYPSNIPPKLETSLSELDHGIVSGDLHQLKQSLVDFAMAHTRAIHARNQTRLAHVRGQSPHIDRLFAKEIYTLNSLILLLEQQPHRTPLLELYISSIPPSRNSLPKSDTVPVEPPTLTTFLFGDSHSNEDNLSPPLNPYLSESDQEVKLQLLAQLLTLPKGAHVLRDSIPYTDADYQHSKYLDMTHSEPSQSLPDLIERLCRRARCDPDWTDVLSYLQAHRKTKHQRIPAREPGTKRTCKRSKSSESRPVNGAPNTNTVPPSCLSPHCEHGTSPQLCNSTLYPTHLPCEPPPTLHPSLHAVEHGLNWESSSPTTIYDSDEPPNLQDYSDNRVTESPVDLQSFLEQYVSSTSLDELFEAHGISLLEETEALPQHQHVEHENDIPDSFSSAQHSLEMLHDMAFFKARERIRGISGRQLRHLYTRARARVISKLLFATKAVSHYNKALNKLAADLAKVPVFYSGPSDNFSTHSHLKYSSGDNLSPSAAFSANSNSLFLKPTHAILDSGAGQHFFNQHIPLENFRPLERVMINASGKAQRLTKGGDFQLALETPEGLTLGSLPINNASRCSNSICPFNLLSVRCLMREGVSFRFTLHNSHMKYRDNYYELHCTNGLYIIDLAQPLVSSTEDELASKVFDSTSNASHFSHSTAFAACAPQRTWHYRCGHVSTRKLKDLQTKGRALGLHFPKDSPHNRKCSCPACLATNNVRRSIPPSRTYSRSANRKGAVVWSDLLGPFPPTPEGHRYAISYTDEYSRYSVVYFLKQKSDAVDTLHALVRYYATLNILIGEIRTDQGGEYDGHNERWSDSGGTAAYLRSSISTSTPHSATDALPPPESGVYSFAFKQACESHKIKHTLMPAYRPELHGIAERWNRTVMTMANAMLSAARISPILWSSAVSHANSIRNKLNSRDLGEYTPFELFTGQIPRFDNLRIWGCYAYKLLPVKHKIPGLNTRQRLIYVGETSDRIGYRCFDPNSFKFTTEFELIFDEESIFRRQALLDLYDNRRSLAEKGASSNIELIDDESERENSISSQHARTVYSSQSRSQRATPVLPVENPTIACDSLPPRIVQFASHDEEFADSSNDVTNVESGGTDTADSISIESPSHPPRGRQIPRARGSVIRYSTPSRPSKSLDSQLAKQHPEHSEDEVSKSFVPSDYGPDDDTFESIPGDQLSPYPNDETNSQSIHESEGSNSRISRSPKAKPPFVFRVATDSESTASASVLLRNPNEFKLNPDPSIWENGTLSDSSLASYEASLQYDFDINNFKCPKRIAPPGVEIKLDPTAKRWLNTALSTGLRMQYSQSNPKIKESGTRYEKYKSVSDYSRYVDVFTRNNFPKHKLKLDSITITLEVI